MVPDINTPSLNLTPDSVARERQRLTNEQQTLVRERSVIQTELQKSQDEIEQIRKLPMNDETKKQVEELEKAVQRLQDEMARSEKTVEEMERQLRAIQKKEEEIEELRKKKAIEAARFALSMPEEWTFLEENARIQLERKQILDADGSTEYANLRRKAAEGKKLYDESVIKKPEGSATEEQVNKVAGMILGINATEDAVSAYDRLKGAPVSYTNLVAEDAKNYHTDDRTFERVKKIIETQWVRVNLMKQELKNPNAPKELHEFGKKCTDLVDVYRTHEKHFTVTSASDTPEAREGVKQGLWAIYELGMALDRFAQEASYTAILPPTTAPQSESAPSAIASATPSILPPATSATAPQVRPTPIITPPQTAAVVPPVTPQINIPPSTPQTVPAITPQITQINNVSPVQPAPAITPAPSLVPPSYAQAPSVVPVSPAPLNTPQPTIKENFQNAPESILKQDGTIRVPAYNASLRYQLDDGTSLQQFLPLNSDSIRIDMPDRFSAVRVASEWVITPSPYLRGTFTVRFNGGQESVRVNEAPVNVKGYESVKGFADTQGYPEVIPAQQTFVEPQRPYAAPRYFQPESYPARPMTPLQRFFQRFRR